MAVYPSSNALLLIGSNALLLIGCICLQPNTVGAQLSQQRRLELNIEVPDFDEYDPVWTNLDIPDNAAHLGMWTALIPWPLVSIHAAVLPDGKVVTYGTDDILEEVPFFSFQYSKYVLMLYTCRSQGRRPTRKL